MKSMKVPNAWGINFCRWQVVMLTKHPDGKQVKVRIESVESNGETAKDVTYVVRELEANICYPAGEPDLKPL